MLELREDSYQQKVILPNLLRIARPTQGQHFLDLACGQGFFSRAFEKEGAHVTGVDLATELIVRAKKLGPPTIRYMVGDAVAMPFLENDTFDVVVTVLAIQNIEKYQEALSECARVLVPAGRLLMVLNHPAFRVPHASSWGYDDAHNVQFRRIDRYLSEAREEIIMHPGQANSPQTISWHRPLQVYSKALAKAGFSISRMEEWISNKQSDSGPRAAAENRARKEFPLFLCLECKKV